MKTFNYSKMRSFVVVLALLLMGQDTLAQDMSVSQQGFRIPVLVNKENNPVLRIVFNNTAAGNTAVDGIRLELSGTTDLKDIKAIRIYYAGKDTGFSNLTDPSKMSLFGSTNTISSITWVRGQQIMAAGLHAFHVSVELNKNANLLHRVAIRCIAYGQGEKQIMLSHTVATLQRIGYAVRQHNEEGVHTYRIPGLATAKDGSLLAIYDVRRESGRDLQGDIDIGLNRSTDKGNSWLPMQIAIDMGTWGGLPQKFNGVSDANILVDSKTGNIFIAGLWMHGVLDSTGKWIEGLTDTSTVWNHQWRDHGSQPGFEVKQSAQFMIVKSTDNGKTWSQPINLTRQIKQEEWWLLAPAPGHGITLRDGTLVFPTQGRDKKGKAFSNITYSKDGGATWHTSHAATKESTTENMAVELSDGSIMLNMRYNKNRTDTSSHNGRFIAVTSDLGNNWTEHSSSRGALPEPTCMASIIRHDYRVKGQKKSILLFSNPDSKTAREHMTIKVSYDDGKTWVDSKKILLDERKSRGYSCLTSIDNDTIGILYESSQVDLVFQKIRINELL